MKKKVFSKSMSWILSVMMIFGTVIITPATLSVQALIGNKSGFSTNYTLGNDPGQNVANVAYAQIGKKASNLGYDTEWCAMFAHDCAELAGQGSAVPNQPWVPSLPRDLETAGAVPVSAQNARPGDILLIDANYSGDPEHVEIVYKVENGNVYSIGGNTGTYDYTTSSVCNPRIHPSHVFAIYRPNYSGTVPPNPDPDQNPYTEPSRNLYVDSPYLTGNDVKWVQWCLAKLGYSIDIDGIYGNDTANKVKQFQSANGLTVDGICGADTRAKLKAKTQTVSLSAPVVTVTPGTSVTPTKISWNSVANAKTYDLRIWSTSEDIWSLTTTSYEIILPAGEHRIQVAAVNGSSFTYCNEIKFTVKSGGTDIGNKFYAQIIHLDKVLTQQNGNVVLSTNKYSDSQIWYFEKVDGLYYRITNMGNKECLDAAGLGTANGTNIGTYGKNNTDAQKWCFVKSGGNYIIVPKYSGRIALDLNGGNMADGTNIQIWERNGTFAQEFVVLTPTYTISYNMNGGSGSISNQTKTYGQDLTLSSTKPTRTGYAFVGWNTNKDATSAQYAAGGKYTANSGATLYAIWSINKYTVSYNMNGGSGSISNQTKTYGQDLTLSSTKPTRTGYDFVGWNTNKDATTAQYQPGGKYTANSGATLYAIWKAKQVTVTFYRNLNSDDTTTASQTFTYGVSGQSFSNKNWSRDGYTMIGWSENRSATDKQYSTLSSVDPNWIISKSPKVNLYAVWKESGYVMSESEGAGRTIPDGDYYIISELNQDFFIDIPGNDFDTANGKNVQMWIWNSLMPPKEGYDCFRIEYLNNGFYKITQIGTNMCLDVSGGSLLKGTNVQMWKYDGAKSQQWSIEKTSHGYRIRSRCNAYCLDISGGKHESGINIRCWDANDARCQSFSFIPRKMDEKPISDGVYTIKTNVNKTSFLDVYGSPGEFKAGSNVQLYNFTNAFVAEKFTINYVSDGWYKILEKTSGLALELVDPDTNFLNNSKNVKLASDNGGKNQLWKIRKNSDGTYYIINKANGYYLDLESSKTDNATNVSTHEYNEGNNQKWIIELETYNIKYNMNGGSGSIDDQIKTYGVDLTLSSKIPTRDGYTFVGWNSHANATTAEFQPNWKYVNNYGIVLYAIWKINAPTDKPVISNLKDTYSEGSNLTFTWSKVDRATSYGVAIWRNPGGESTKIVDTSVTTTSYTLNNMIPAKYGIYIYAKNESGSISSDLYNFYVPFTIKYDLNGGTGTISPTYKKAGIACNLSSTKPTRPGYTFVGWNTDKNATTALYQPGAKYTVNGNVILYAIWKENPLTNTAILAAEDVKLGSYITINASATGGVGDYTYAVWYKLSSASSWTTKQKYSKNATIKIKPESIGKYDISVKVKDGSGTIVKKAFTVNVFAPLKNTTTVSSTSIGYGGTFTVKAKATGGLGDYTYAVYYKKASATKWTTAQNYSSTKTVTIKPKYAEEYDVSVKVKDSRGVVAKKTFKIKVTKPTNTSKVASTTITLGNTIDITCSATGGSGFYQYAVYYKKSSDTSWKTKQSYSSNYNVSIKPASKTKYDVSVKVKDSLGNVSKQTFTITVK